MQHAEVLLPIAHIPEIHGHYLSITGSLNTWDKVTEPYGLSRSAADVYEALSRHVQGETMTFATWWAKNTDGHVGAYQHVGPYPKRDVVPISRIHASQADPTLRRGYARQYVPNLSTHAEIAWIDTRWDVAEDQV